MKNSRIALGIAIAFTAMTISFTSCKKKEEKPDEPEEDTEQTTTSDNHLAEGSASDVEAMGSQVSENNGTLSTFKSLNNADALMFTGGCATISSNANGTVLPIPTQYTVDFGTTGTCISNDGRIRKGKLFFDFSGSTNNAKYYRNPGFKMVVTSSNYEVEGNQVNITKTVINTTDPVVIGQNAYDGTHNITWSINANVTIIKSNGGTVSWTCNRTKELINTNDPNCYNGQGNPINWMKAKVQLNGTAGGTNAKGESFSAVATNVVRDFNCAPEPVARPHRHPFVSGSILYSPGNRPARLIDFGNGGCDFNATMTIKGITYNIVLQ